MAITLGYSMLVYLRGREFLLKCATPNRAQEPKFVRTAPTVAYLHSSKRCTSNLVSSVSLGATNEYFATGL